MRMIAAPTPFCASDSLLRFASSRLWYGPSRTRYRVPLSGVATGLTAASNPVNAMRAFRLSASRSSVKAPACSQYTSPEWGWGEGGEEPGLAAALAEGGGTGAAAAGFVACVPLGEGAAL